ncbi:MAG: prepilin-type N-terminal cleavage/methylation domain-containing protein [Comamonadaceae bacterium]|nr:MAG: prepilin-type N-terminal cleavage/methylation domain-containing protein [Comamonadaceae bacterium]
MSPASHSSNHTVHHHRKTPKRRSRGVTLVELIVCISMLAVLVGLAAPAFSNVLSGWRRDSAIRDFMGDLQLARATAVRTSRAVVMCVSTDGIACATGPDSDDWRRSWLVFSDLNGNNARDNNEPVIVQRGPIAGLQRMRSKVAPGRFAFRSNGLLNSGNTTVHVLANEASEEMRIRINATGRASLLQVVQVEP